MKNLLTTFLGILAILGAVVPTVAFASPTERPVPPGETTSDESFVPCGTKDTKKLVNGQLVDAQVEVTGADGVKRTVYGDGIVDNPCKFTDVIELAKRLIMGWIIAGVIVATMGFAYAGLLYITAAGASEKISHAHMIFVKTFWGLVFMLAAWLIAYSLEQVFLSDTARCNSFLTTPEDRAKLKCD
ncbi:MAG: hypothetical protein AAB767_02190 [Patescibacteria group bacterium]